MSEDKRSKMLAEERIPKLLTKLTVPAIVGMVVSAVYNIADAIFVGIIGIEAIGAIAIAFPILMLIAAVGQTFGMGSASYISRLLGEKNIDQANKAGTTALITTLVVAVLFSVFGLINLESILIFFGTTETILPYAIDYTSIMFIGSVFQMCNMCMNNMLRAEGSATMSMIALTTGAVLNIVLDPIFIFTLGMGIKGAAVATLLSQLVSTVLLFGYYVTKRSLLKLHFRYFSPSKIMYFEIMKIGFPTLIRQCLTSIAMALMNGVAAVYGDVAIAAIGIISRIFSIGMLILFGFGQGFQPVAGFCYGAMRYDRLLESIKVTLSRTTIFCIVLTLVFMGFTEPIVRVFTTDIEVIEIANQGLRYFSILLPIFGFNITINVLFQALGRGRAAAVLSLARQGIFFIPAIIILPKLFELKGLLLSQTVADFLTTFLTIILAVKVINEIRHLRSTTDTAKIVGKVVDGIYFK